MDKSRLPNFYKYSVSERLRLLYERQVISEESYHSLMDGVATLDVESADRMVENVVGVFGLPMGLGLNFVINDKPYIVPLVVEEPSIIAALSSAAKLVGGHGGFEAHSEKPLMMGQIQVVDITHPARARQTLLQNKDKILNLANSLHPNMVARGGGAKDMEVIIHPSASARGDMVVAQLLVDTCDAMGANLVNTMCEGVANLVEEMTGGTVFLRILSNLTDRAMVSASCKIPVSMLEGKGYAGESVRDGIILANDFAAVDSYRAATHNKGIMNGIDPVAIATGNDWRAIESAAHAYAGRGNTYTCLTSWTKDDEGNLVGGIRLPLKVGTVGGSLQSNPGVKIAHEILCVESARELAELMAVVGLAQNFSALRALSTDGIQRGHMTLHARSVAMTAGATPDNFDKVVDKLVASGEIKIWKAKDIIRDIELGPAAELSGAYRIEPELVPETRGAGYGKVILLGEHAVVYGSHAIAAPVKLSIQAQIKDYDEGVNLTIPRWGVEQRVMLNGKRENSLSASLDLILERLHLKEESMSIEVWPHVPRAMGLGASAALAVGVIRALDQRYKLNLSDTDVNGIAFEVEKLAHGGTPSGIDNTLATYRQFMLYKKGHPPVMKEIFAPQPIPIVIGLSGTESLTATMVTKVRNNWENNRFLYERIFAEIDGITLEGVKAIENNNLTQLGELMNICQGLLNALGVSSWEIEELIQIARDNGAVGAKLTGGGGGGSMVAICPDNSERVAAAMRKAGYRAMITEIGGTPEGI